VDYEARFEHFLNRRGTDTLKILGLEVAFDAQRLTSSNPIDPNGSGVSLASTTLTGEDWKDSPNGPIGSRHTIQGTARQRANTDLL
jgi:hypothetical protein